MSGFSIVFEPDPNLRAHKRRLLEARVREIGFRALEWVEAPPYGALLHSRLLSPALEKAEGAEGEFALAAGAFLFDGEWGSAAAARFLARFSGKMPIVEQAFGQFALLLRKGGLFHILPDRLGTLSVYVNAAGTAFSTSFLCLCDLEPRLTLSAQGAAEYLFKGAVFGDETPFEEIRTLPAGAHARLGPAGPEIEMRPIALPDPAQRSRSPVEDGLARLRADIKAVVTPFGGRVSSALSAGYDSRLMLALLLDLGVRPDLYVYGPASDPDVVIARLIAEGEGLPIAHIDKDTLAEPAPDAFADTLRHNFLSDDGYMGHGLFNNGSERLERFRRYGTDHAHLNGGGGEIFRVFFNLPDRAVTTDAFVAAYFADTEPGVLRRPRARAAYLHRLGEKVAHVVGGRNPMPRHAVEWLYPMFRCRAWFGRHNSIYNWWGFSVLPFFDYRVAMFAAPLPVAAKLDGRIEARLIAALDPRLARYPTGYGHDFSGPPPLRARLLDRVGRYIPARARHAAYRARRFRHKAASVPHYLGEEYLRAGLPHGVQVLEPLFDISRLRDPLRRNRFYSLEYLAQVFGDKVRLSDV